MSPRTHELLALGAPTYPRIAELLREHDPVRHNTVMPISAARGCSTARELRKARDQASDTFCSTMGWTRGEAFSSDQLRAGRVRPNELDVHMLTAHQNGPIDLPEYFHEGLVPVSIVSHTLCPLEQIWAYAELENLRIGILPGSWDRPGERTGVVFMRRAYKSRYERRKAS
jgi:hypothetical protein